MEKIPTAEEFYGEYCNKRNRTGSLTGTERSELLTEFAKLHVEAALKEASEKAICIEYMVGEYEVDKDSILNAYPLNNIK